MEVYASLPLDLARTGAAPSFVYPEWASGQSYPAGTIRRKVCSGVSWDYRAKFGHTSSSSNGPVCGWNTYQWARVGLSGTTGGWTYTTNTRLSDATTWTTGSAIAVGDSRFDAASQHDYVASLALTSGQNTIRPSEALRSSDELIRQRWVDLGAANAWAPLDQEIDCQLEGRDANGEILSHVQFNVEVSTQTPLNRVSFFGLENIDSIEVKVYVAAALVQTVTAQIDPEDEDRYVGILPNAASLKLEQVDNGSSCYLIIKATQGPYSNNPIKIGTMAVGYAAGLGVTVYGLQHTYLSFSTIERDPTFGRSKFIKRGTAAIVRATVEFDPREIPTYAVLHLLKSHSGSPCVWDFSNSVGSDPSMLVFGFAKEPTIVLENWNRCVISMEVEGLVE